MIDRQMQFLNHIGFRLRSLDAHVTHVLQLAVFCASQSNDLQTFCMGGGCSKQDVPAIATGGNSKEHIPRFSVTINLLREAE